MSETERIMGAWNADKADKLSGIKPGDRVRVTFEGVVADNSRPDQPDIYPLSIEADGRCVPNVFHANTVKADTFHIERIEPPLKVGDRVRGREIVNRVREGEILAIHGGEAWVSWGASHLNFAEKTTAFVSDLERIA